LKPQDNKVRSYAGYAIALFFILISIYLYSRNLILKSSLDVIRMDYETLLSDKLQLERSYYRLKEERRVDTASSPFLSSSQFIDSLKAMKKEQEREIARLYREIEKLRRQISHDQKINQHQ